MTTLPHGHAFEHTPTAGQPTTGRVLGVRGTVVEVTFADDLPPLGAALHCEGAPMTIPVGSALLGRVIDLHDRPIDGGPTFHDVRPVSIHCPPPRPAERRPSGELYPTGIKVIDLLCPFTYLFETANFLILTAVLGWLLFRPVRRALENRRMALTKEAEEVAAKQAEVERLQDETRQRYAALDTELDRLRHDERVAAQQEAEQLQGEARAAIEREREAARQQLAHLEDAQLAHLATAVATAAGAVVERLLRQLDGPDVERGLIRAACRGLQALDGNDLGAVLVESAHPLDQGRQDELTTALGKASRTLEFRISSSLGAGIRISTSRGLIDASATGLAAFARGALAEQLGMPQNGHSRTPTSTPEETSNHA